MLFISESSWLTWIVAAIVLSAIGGIAFFATFRRGWSAWPILLVVALFVPLLSYAAVIAILYVVSVTYGLAGGFVVHLGWLALVALGPMIIGSALGLASKRRRSEKV